jgi:hypothetical protein
LRIKEFLQRGKIGVDNVEVCGESGAMKLSLDVPAILNRFADGSLTELARRLTEKGFPITKQGVSRWNSSGRLPMDAWLTISEIEAEKNGTLPDLRKFMLRSGR